MVIVGGGLSGLAAGVQLASENIPVVILEQKPALGGRAYSYTDATTGDIVDNGQHLLIAGYQGTFRFLDTIGALDLLRIQEYPDLLFHHPRRGFTSFTLPKLPSPFHLLWGIFNTDLLSLKDKVSLCRAGLALQTSDADDMVKAMTVEEWLDGQNQSVECKRSFWEPLAVSIMNEKIATASASVFLHSMREAFLRGWKNAAAAIPIVGLSQLYVDGASRFITDHKGTVRCNADVVRIVRDGETASIVELRDGEIIPCNAVILAVPSYRIPALIPSGVQMTIAVDAIGRLDSSPIISVHLWFSKEVMQDEFVGVIGKRVQWFFNRRMILREKGKGGHVSAVISAAHEYVDLTNEALTTMAVEDLRSVYPDAVAPPTHSIVIREKRATFSCTPKSETLRPDHQTSAPNLFVAGDWTNTGLPATIEGAIISGERCARLAKHWRQQLAAR
ncbi:MAG: hydroxysqualene dehydroxylase HpnE [Bacteroidota bacterium]